MGKTYDEPGDAPVGRPELAMRPDPARVDETLSIEELASRSGFTTRSIREFQSQGMLPPPERQGRHGHYHLDHLDRLRLIERLQGDGFSRAAITALMEAWDEGRTLADVLGFEPTEVAPAGPATAWAWDRGSTLSLDEVRDLFGSDIRALGSMIDLGLIRPRGDEYELGNSVLLQIGQEMRRSGVPLDLVLSESAYLRDRVDEISEHFLQTFERMVFEPFVERGGPPHELELMRKGFERFLPLLTASVSSVLEESMMLAFENILATVPVQDGDEDVGDAAAEASSGGTSPRSRSGRPAR